MSHSPEEVKKHVKVYVAVFLTLAVLTIVTVAVAYLHLPMIPAIAVALLIATFKGSLVAGFFMHLFQEKPIVLWILLLTVFFFFHLLLIPVLSH
jgi:cytochrome c oxidase subunit IV